MTVTSAPVTRPSVTTKVLRAMILAYQAASSGRSPACRFVPSCSDYALEAIDRFGARKGFVIGRPSPRPVPARRPVRARPGPRCRRQRLLNS